MKISTFQKKFVPVTESGCWIWLGASNGRYGIIWNPRNGKKYTMAHRVSYEMHKGQIPDEMLVCHTCDVGLCVNPDHLFLGTQVDNMQDMISKGRKAYPENAGHHGNHARGINNGQAKIDSITVLSIRRTYDTRACSNIAELSRQLHVSESQTRRIVRRQNWKHI